MTSIPFGPQLIGRTEKALNALLDRELAGTGLSEPQWVALTLTVTADGPREAELVARIAGALRVGEAREHLAALAAAGMVVTADDLTVRPTERGMALWTSVRAATGRIADALWNDLPDADREVAARVLNTVLTRAGAALEAV
ncbi:MarR family transcriptional regulator [Paractinoplanes brasiliensis]|uniref:DNA-binding MarR family transcriptional regulator n=1 Tax=Paractinoplanes brasiliensis TaxID=52695 RepID=A0A4R6JBB4_9ACTN|nr:MarR family transcriptional regulator [Actinoplanes brasiliensis]TDO31795.1 hypothetical protein C8E87_7227 [Actinoplanes brasiliensis]GID30607.1 hypothetical protein Abr02nite_55900 [Actinoplanes brasiliensis]